MPVENLSTNMQTIGQYDLVEKIAEGGMGTVYRGRNHVTGANIVERPATDDGAWPSTSAATTPGTSASRG